MPGFRGRPRASSRRRFEVKLLLEQNLSHRLVESLADSYPGTVHVRSVGLAQALDVFRSCRTPEGRRSRSARRSR